MSTKTRVLVIAIVVAFVAFLDGAIVNVALPAIREELGGGIVVQQWVVDGYLISLGAFILLAGSLSDAFGRVRIMRIGLYGFGLASLACALAPSGLVLVVARVFQGAAGALLVPSALALIISTFPVAEQGKAIGRWTAWTTAAFLGGPLLGGILVDLAHWRWIFLVNVVPIAAALILLRGHEPEPRATRRVRIDYLGAALGIIALGGPVFGLIEHERLGWSHLAVVIPIVVGVVALIAFIWWEKRTIEPMLPLSMFRIRNFGFGNVATLFIYGGLGLGGFLLPVFVQEVGHYPATVAGLVSLPSGLLLIALSPRFGALSARFGPRIFMTAGPLILAAGYLWLLLIDDSVTYVTQVLPAILLMGLGIAVTVAPLTAATLGAVQQSRAGIGSAINNAVARIAGLVAVASTGVILGSQLDVDGFHRAALVTAGLMVLGAAVSFIGIRTPTLSESDAPSTK